MQTKKFRMMSIHQKVTSRMELFEAATEGPYISLGYVKSEEIRVTIFFTKEMSELITSCSTLGFLLCHKMVVSSAKSVKLPDMLIEAKSFIYNKKRTGPSTDPCGTPHRLLSCRFHNLIASCKVGLKPGQRETSEAVAVEFLQQYFVIHTVKCFRQITKYRRSCFTVIYFTVDFF